MKKPSILPFLLILLALSSIGCYTSRLLPAATPPATTTPRATRTPKSTLPPETHITLPSGLRIDEYALKYPPMLEPLTFIFLQDPYGGLQLDIQNELRRRSRIFPNFTDDSQNSMSVPWEGQELTATLEFSATGNTQAGTFEHAFVKVAQNGELIGTVFAGDGSPFNSLQGLWAYDDHWVLEIAYVTRTVSTPEVSGMIFQDGASLNEQFGYQEMFAFQLMSGKPFYFFEDQDHIGISYDNQATFLGYDKIHHYKCCSGAELNPRAYEDLVAFFAERDGVWYYVVIVVETDKYDERD